MNLILIALLIPSAGVLASPAQAQQSPRTNATYDGWISAFQVMDGSNFYLAKSSNDRSAGSWSQGYLITEAQDAYFQNHSAARYTQITHLINDFLAKHGTNWSGDTWDDDLEWIILAMVRGYEITGNAKYLNAAISNWNLVYNRGWDSTFGGGIWENKGDNTSKCVLSNAPFVIEGVELYRATGTQSYLTTSQLVYEWTRNHLFNYTNTSNANGVPGQADECVHSDGVHVSDNVYNMGLMVNAARSLYRATGNPEYFGDVQLAAAHVMQKWPILSADYPSNGYFSADHFIRGLAAFATENDLWSLYGTYLQKNADASWAQRRTDYNITGNHWTKPTTTGNIYAMETGASVTVQASLPLQFNLAGTYTIQNAKSGLYLDVSGASKSNKAAVIQSSFASGASSQLWTFVPTAGGCYQIKNSNSGLVLNVKGHSTMSGALVQQNVAQGMQPGNDQWLPALNTDGTYSFYNLNSGMPLDLPEGTSTNGAQFDQAFTSNLDQQRFRLVVR